MKNRIIGANGTTAPAIDAANFVQRLPARLFASIQIKMTGTAGALSSVQAAAPPANAPAQAAIQRLLRRTATSATLNAPISSIRQRAYACAMGPNSTISAFSAMSATAASAPATRHRADGIRRNAKSAARKIEAPA